MSNQDVFKLMEWLNNSPECIQTGAGNRYLYYIFLYTVFRDRAYYGTRCIQLMTIGSGDVYLQADDVDSLMVKGMRREETGSLYMCWEENRGVAKMWLGE